MKGWVYLATNPVMEGIIKIGFSLRDPSIRILELSNTSVPFDFEMLYTVLVEDAEAIEQELHKSLASKRVSGKREFFRSDLQTVLDHLHQTIRKLGKAILFEEKLYSSDLHIDHNFLPQLDVNDVEEIKSEIVREFKDAHDICMKDARKDKNLYYIEFLVDMELAFRSRLDDILSRSEQCSLGAVNSKRSGITAKEELVDNLRDHIRCIHEIEDLIEEFVTKRNWKR
jgi:hypothetical protein